MRHTHVQVAIYLPMVIELPVAMLACARIGAVHSVVFGGFSAESLAGRIHDCKANILITADGVMRGNKVCVSVSVSVCVYACNFLCMCVLYCMNTLVSSA
jgi:acyl-coenzyme A synthetase/AMP-(fatty) acid ligase